MSENRNRANRQNAERSSGPKSETGKFISRQNALKHGLRAQQITIFDERQEDFEALQEALVNSLNPEGPIEEHLVHRIAACLWRLQRIPTLESGVLEFQSLRRDLKNLEEEVRQENEPFRGIQFGQPDADDWTPNQKSRRTKLLNKFADGRIALGKAFTEDIEWKDVLGKLARYENHISRELFRALAEFRQLQRNRNGSEASPIDVV
jgi:hypothetical protein